MSARVQCTWAVFALGMTSSLRLAAAPPNPAAMAAARRYGESVGGQAMVVMYEGRVAFEGHGNVWAPDAGSSQQRTDRSVGK